MSGFRKHLFNAEKRQRFRKSFANVVNVENVQTLERQNSPI